MEPRPVYSDAQASEGLPLSGVTIADFSWVLQGPRATSWLGAMGARVIKIEGQRRPDQYRNIAIWAGGQGPSVDGSGAFHTLNFSKLDIALDFTTPRGLELAKQICALSDVVVENFAFGVMERVGLGYEDVKKLREDVIFVSSSALGRNGPDKHHIAYGNLVHAVSGLNSVIGYDGEFGSTGSTFADPLTGSTMVFAILSALWHRRRTGQGQRIDLSMVESALMQIPDHVLDYTANGRVSKSDGNTQGFAAPHDTYECDIENTYVAIAVYSDDDWRRFAEALGDPEWTQDERFRDARSRLANRNALDEHLRPWVKQRNRDEVAALLQSHGVSAAPVYSAKDMYEDEHLNARHAWVQLDHPVVGRKPVGGLPWHIDPGPAEQYWPAPLLGQHTDHVLRDILHLDEAEIASLRVDGIVA
ncbi:MAG: CaiB/BaiF CoA transferase family protein [Dehalococcoidia bacterium]